LDLGLDEPLANFDELVVHQFLIQLLLIVRSFRLSPSGPGT
jgi:hypothetical protein